ncbi:protealysin inhibitor emfourin [[Erwinia] mediterraneensis]|uniref:protealysin inhibitor emfourin n=1 Tax=[Erwinia] mediterraneensis TaxID=2161819 RepID=UPI001031824F|nr:protealysin inhibitor emfourin [[Erwinia] mediterraneensis]
MKSLPELTDDAIVQLAREGGFAWIPKLNPERRFMLGQLPQPQKERVCHILRQALPYGEPQEESGKVGRGDQRYFRIQITYATHNESGSLVILIPEQVAPPELEALWRDGE